MAQIVLTSFKVYYKNALMERPKQKKKRKRKDNAVNAYPK